MDALLTALVVWLATNFGLPANFDHPRIEFVPATRMTALLQEEIGQQKETATSPTESDAEIVSLYNRDLKTVYLPDGWTGKTPAELSILVHEMVHHLQNLGGLKFACPQEREELAYKAQERWLKLFGHDLLSDFQMDPFTILVKSHCFF